MGLTRCFNLRCDQCGAIHKTTCDTPRRARAVAKRDGWQRRNMGTIRTYEDGSGVYQEWGPWRDFCPTCLDSMDERA